ncbi:MAG TPA: hypothetical protein VF449_05560 [Parvibaculum sp.]
MRPPLSFQLLNCVFEIRTESATIAEYLRYMIVDAEQAVPVTHRTAFDVIQSGDTYTISENGKFIVERYAANVLDALYPLLYGRVLEKLGQPAQVHGGCATTPGGKRFIVAGPGSAGKTTLLSHMLLQGLKVESDDVCLLEGTTVTPLPRRFHVKEPSLRLLPEIAALAPGLPWIDGGRGFRIYSYSPTELGRRWVIAPGPVEAIFFLEPNHGGQTRVTQASRIDMVSRLMQQGRSRNTVGKWIGDLCRLVDTVKCYVLVIGDKESALEAIQKALG